jgi:hypothetical protein
MKIKISKSRKRCPEQASDLKMLISFAFFACHF